MTRVTFSVDFTKRPHTRWLLECESPDGTIFRGISPADQREQREPANRPQGIICYVVNRHNNPHTKIEIQRLPQSETREISREGRQFARLIQSIILKLGRSNDAS